MQFAKRILSVNPSLTLGINSRANKLRSEGKDITSFAAGEPDVDTPDFVKQAAIKAINDGFTKYTPTSGVVSLKQAISAKFKRDNQLDYLPNQITVTCGAKHAIYNIIQVLVDKGEEVLIPIPFWVSYPEMVSLSQGKSKFIKTKASDNFKINPDVLKAKIGKKTKLLILNSPSNPSGTVYTREELQVIADICVEKKIYVISDEIYEKIIFDGLKHYSIASFNKEIYDLTITVNGVSKSSSMTGWRIGYLAGPLSIVEAINKLQDHSTSNPCSISQMAALAALNAPEDFVANMCAEFAKRRDYIAERLKKMPKIKPVIPQGAFYIYVNISKLRISAMEVANRLLDEAGIAVIPGEGFGTPDYIRISFATSMELIKKGMDKLELWLAQLQKRS
jgi:aspartate aminotransferase